MENQKQLSKLFKSTHGKMIGFYRGRILSNLKMIVYEISPEPKRNQYGDYKHQTSFIKKTHWNNKVLRIELDHFYEPLVIPREKLDNYLIFKDIEL